MLSVLTALLVMLIGVVATSNGPIELLRPKTSAPSDIIVAGGLDGRVFAIHAWSGDVLWSFDSGGPMVDSSQCSFGSAGRRSPFGAPDAAVQGEPVRMTTAAQESDKQAEEEMTVATAAETKAIHKREQQEQAIAASAAFMERLLPSYDGRLYHFADSKVTELEMTMADIVNVNGPVRLAADQEIVGSLSDVLLFGEKRSEMFALDATSGVAQPFASSSAQPSQWSNDIVFGRSEYWTQALHARNASFARCFRISEYFVQLARHPHCAVNDADSATARYVPPEIVVVPKDVDAVRPEEGSTIAGFDPWTNEQLWEFEVADFDVLAVYGLSPSRGSTFYQWKVDGPSSSRKLHIHGEADAVVPSPKPVKVERGDDPPVVLPAGEEDTVVAAEDASEEPSGSKQLSRVVPRTWDSVESEFRLRMLDGNYFLESNGGEDVSNLSDNDDQLYESSDLDADFHRRVSPRRRRILWEPIVNDGKSGVFITYYHAGAMMVGILVGCILIAWGCYVKGLSASIAQTAIKSMDQSQFFVSHVHQLTIERPGEENITISSVISRALMMDTAGVERPLRLLGNGEVTEAPSTPSHVEVDPDTEAMMMEKFSRMAATEAAALIAGGRYSSSRVNLKQLEYELDSKSSSSALTPARRGSASRSESGYASRNGGYQSRLAIQCEDDVIVTSDDPVFADYVFSGDADLSDERVELLESDEGSAQDDASSADKSLASSWNSETTGSCYSSGSKNTKDDNHNSAKSESDSVRDSDSDDAPSSPSQRKSSDASSSDASKSGDSEVFLPFVCQSRFVNEFEQISAIGKGGFGQVMLAENRLDGRKYAIKRVGLNLKNQTSKTLQKFLREVKILALLDHPNIVRYYQAWLEKVEESTAATESTRSSFNGDSSTFGAAAKNYSMSNLLAPISELDFSVNRDRTMGSYYEDSGVDDDGGFEWERDSSAEDDDKAWKEEDLVVKNRVVSQRRAPAADRESKQEEEAGSGDDSSCYTPEKCDHWLYIQMQYCAGRNLGDYLAVPNRPMELPKLLKIFVQIASALAHVHSCGLIHRDLKPANIFVADTDVDSIKLGDFGLSRYATNVNVNSSVEDPLPAVNGANGGNRLMGSSAWSVSASNVSESNDVTAGVGTYLYASPEQAAGKKYNAKTDIYSLGMILFELCHERFGTTMERYVTLRSARESVFPDDFVWHTKCPELVDMLLQLLNRDPLARPTADEVVHWGQALYETSVAQRAMDVVRSPRLHHGGLGGHVGLQSIDHLVLSPSSAFALQVEAAGADASSDSDSGSSVERRGLPDHNLLKQVCDVIGGVHDGKVEIKKFGFHLEAESVQILEFVLDPHAALVGDLCTERSVVECVIAAIRALDGVRAVRRAHLHVGE